MHKIWVVLTCPCCHHQHYLGYNSFRKKWNNENDDDTAKKQHSNHKSTTSTWYKRPALWQTCTLRFRPYLDSLRPPLPSDEQFFSFDIKTIACRSGRLLSRRRQWWQKRKFCSRKFVHDSSTCHVCCSMTQRVGNSGIPPDSAGLGLGYDENFTHYTCKNFHFFANSILWD